MRINYSHQNKNEYLAYSKYCAKKNNNSPGLIFLCGFKSDMHGTKAEAIAKYAEGNDHDLIRFDYFGHGESSGKFIDGTISLWLKNTLTIIDKLSGDKPQILVGSSMGGWIMLLAALLRPEKVVGLIGLAAAPDFSEELIWNCMTHNQREHMQQHGQIDFSNEFCEDAYPISHQFIIDGRDNLLLNNEIPINVPVRLIHGMNDMDVPFSTSIKIAEKLTSNDVEIKLIKNSGHRLSSEYELEITYETISSMIETI